jgi:hypothetical protein
LLLSRAYAHPRDHHREFGTLFPVEIDDNYELGDVKVMADARHGFRLHEKGGKRYDVPASL